MAIEAFKGVSDINWPDVGRFSLINVTGIHHNINSINSLPLTSSTTADLLLTHSIDNAR